jgi:hypothetical protein
MRHFPPASTYNKIGYPALAYALNSLLERLQHKYTSPATLLPAHTSLSGRRERRYADELKLVIAKELVYG